MSRDRTNKHRRSLSLTTTNSMLFASSATSAPPSLTTSPWTQISTRGLGRQLQLSLVVRLKCGKPQAVCEDKYGGLQCLCYQHIAVWQRDTDYICREESRFNTFHLRSIRRILGISWLDKVTNADVLSRAVFLDNADNDGWVMSAVWIMDAFRKTSSMVNWHWGGEQPVILTFDIKMSA